MVTFSVVFFAAFVYVVARGALDWGPVQRQVRLSSPLSPSTSGATPAGVRRVGLEGRPEEPAA
jgi:hypothetical protein